jgi:hypothetical protein
MSDASLRGVFPALIRRQQALRRSDSAQRVLTRCPVTNRVTATEAFLSRRDLSRLRSDICYYCAFCETPHVATRHVLWIDESEAT